MAKYTKIKTKLTKFLKKACLILLPWQMHIYNDPEAQGLSSEFSDSQEVLAEIRGYRGDCVPSFCSWLTLLPLPSYPWLHPHCRSNGSKFAEGPAHTKHSLCPSGAQRPILDWWPGWYCRQPDSRARSKYKCSEPQFNSGTLGTNRSQVPGKYVFLSSKSSFLPSG